ncbi:MAG TPA: aromatic ring-hydroxylating dioxygenase subunit alpha [Byssovorax sp.]|jgi:phenylpropionate dioxygenase-like ring-hydroxylating dioxygenase large terminal subunit
MLRETELSLIDRLLALHEAGTTSMVDDESRIDVAAYTSKPRFEAERAALFQGLPVIVLHSSELAAPGDFVTHDALGLPLVFMRGQDGVARAFLNVCRHRGARLADAPCGNKKAFVCGYHGWSYTLTGSLLHVPQAEGFPRREDRGLVPVPCEERAGFVWVVADRKKTLDLGAFLGPLASELDDFGLARDVAFRTEHVTRKFNWKLLIDAFLDGYHIKRLHRDSVYRFFLDNVNVADLFAPHVRSAVARKGLEKARDVPRGEWRYRDVLSLTYFVFPNTVLVFHPDWVSRITLFPLAVDETLFTHTMIVPAAAAAPSRGATEASTDDRRAHWDKTWRLIHENVFEKEDMVAAAWIQSGLASGANESFACGRFEFPIRWFHDELDRALALAAAGP